MAISSKYPLASICGVFALLALSAPPASAATQIARTFITSSNAGSDANTCAANNPCATLAGAYANTLVGGEINILDGGDYGPLTIEHSLTIRGEGNTLGVTGTGSSVIVVNAGSTDVVNLVGLDILANAATNGIVIKSAGIVDIANCHFRNLSTAIYINPTSATMFVSVKDSLAQNNTNGIVANTSATAKVLIDNVAVFGAGTEGGGDGILADGAHVSVAVNNSTIANNGTGLATLNGGSLFTYGNNRVNFNGDNGGPNQAVLTMK